MSLVFSFYCFQLGRQVIVLQLLVGYSSYATYLNSTRSRTSNFAYSNPARFHLRPLYALNICIASVVDSSHGGWDEGATECLSVSPLHLPSSPKSPPAGKLLTFCTRNIADHETQTVDGFTEDIVSPDCRPARPLLQTNWSASTRSSKSSAQTG